MKKETDRVIDGLMMVIMLCLYATVIGGWVVGCHLLRTEHGLKFGVVVFALLVDGIFVPSMLTYIVIADWREGRKP